MTTTVPEEVKEGSSLADPQGGESTAQMRARATSITPERGTSLLRGWAGGHAVTQRVRQAGEVASILGALANKPGTVLHSQPPTFWQAWDRHRECAGHFGAPLLRGMRLLWGHFHVALVKPALNFTEWITLIPVWLAAAAAGGTESLPGTGSLAAWQPPTFRQEIDLIHECARRFQPQPLGWPLYLLGYVHLLAVKPVLNLAEWVTESPLRFFLTTLLIGAIWYWS